MSRLVEITELALRDGHQSLLATRMALEDMVDACDDIYGTRGAADLYAGVLTVAEKEAGRSLQPLEVLRGLVEATSGGGDCESTAAAYVAVLAS